MKSFKEIYLQEIEGNKVPGDKPVSVFMGRMQPPTKAHIKIIEDAYKKYKQPVVIAVVKSNNEKSPFPVKLIKQILKSSVKAKIEVIELKTGFLGAFMNPLRDQGFEPTVILAGSDRVKTYQSQVDRYKDELNWNIAVKEIPRTGEDISATKVRQAITDGDEKTYQSMTAKGSHKYFKKLQKYMK